MRYSIYSTKPLFGVLVNGVGFSADTDVTRYGPGRRNQTIIHYCLRGSGYFNGSPVHSGQGFLIRPGDWEEYHPDSQDPWAFLWIILSGQNSADVLEYYQCDPDTQIFSYGYVRELEELSREIIQRSTQLTFGMEATEMFLRILNLHFHAPENTSIVRNSSEYAKFAKDYMDLNYHRKLTVQELLDHLGISQPYLYRIFHEAYGQSPKQYLNDLRLKASKFALKTTDLSVSDIGASVGYDDVLSFSSFFSRHVGISPQNYRQQK